MTLVLRDDFQRAWPDPFAAVQQVNGEVYRDKEGRTTPVSYTHLTLPTTPYV